MQKQASKPQKVSAQANIRIKILEYLQLDASKSQKEMAGVFSMKESTYGRYLTRIESEGCISRQVAVLDPGRFGKKTVAFVQFKLNDSGQGPTNKLVKILCDLAEVQEVHSVNGDYDLLAKVRVSENEDVLRLIYKIETIDPNVVDTSTMFTFCVHKETLAFKCS